MTNTTPFERLKILSQKILPFLWCFYAQTVASQTFMQDFNLAAIERTKHAVIYNGAYVAIDYPNGDVPANTGVCTDVLIRAYRSIGADLQQLVHEDMALHFSLYPSRRIWGLTRPDKNVDHRRVPNLQTFFTRNGQTLTVSANAVDYQTGDIVTWKLAGNLPHIGIVSEQKSPATGNPLIVHNIGQGPKLDDMLFDYPVTGHYRYVPSHFSDTANNP